MNAPRPPVAANGYDFALPPAALEGVRTRRMIALAFDFILLMALTGLALFFLGMLGFVTFGLTWLVAAGVLTLFPLVALFYNAVTVSGWRRATPGMHIMDLEMRRTDGSPVPFLHAAVHAVLFYLSWYFLTPFILLVSLIAPNKRCLHDMVADVVVVRRPDL